jgi:LacI family transcriptional regulator
MIKGVVRYSKEYGPWMFYRMPIYYRELHGDKGVVKWAKQWKADAVIAQLSDIDVKALEKLKIPIVIQNYRDRYDAISNLTGDYYSTGAMAAEFFMQRGFRFYAYYGFSDTVWMRERGDGFRDTLKKKGYDVYLFNKPVQNKKTEKWSFDVDKVSSWLQELPKPVALFACDDYYALQITEVCKMFNINVPNDVAVLGVDNDELLCSISSPPLSSIELDVQNGGYELGKLLHDLIEKRKKSPVNVVIKPLHIITRGSTERFAVADHNLKDILQYIEQNHMNPLSVDNLVTISPFSRRVLEKNFKKETGISVYQYIQQFRVEKFAELLVTTDLSLNDAAYMTGFEDYKNVSRIFYKYKSLTPSQYRKKFGTVPESNEQDSTAETK